MKKEFRPRLTEEENNIILKHRTENKENILVIGDIHAPFAHRDYLQFCKDTYVKYNCNKVVFIGDIIDNNFSSYHETDANGMGGLEELELAIERIQDWFKAFPIDTV